MQELTNGSTYSGSPTYLSDDDGKFLFRPLPNFTSCGFCQNNGEEEGFYRSHRIKDKLGVVECPILRKYVCPVCSATGDMAHTIKYCPRNRDGQFNNGASLSDLKKRRNASGKPGVQRGAQGGRLPMVGHWVNEGLARFNNGGKMDEAVAMASNFQNNLSGQTQTSILFKEEMMKREMQQKSVELEQLKRQLNNHLNTNGCSGLNGIMGGSGLNGIMGGSGVNGIMGGSGLNGIMGFKSPSNYSRQERGTRVKLPSPMEGHLKNRRMDYQMPVANMGAQVYQMPVANLGDQEFQMPLANLGAQEYQMQMPVTNLGTEVAATNLGDQLAELREGTVPHES